MPGVITGSVRPARQLPRVYATDGSAQRSRRGTSWHTGQGWICTDGTYGLAAELYSPDECGRDAAAVAELRAVWHAARDVVPGRAAVLLLDSEHAVRCLDAWARGRRLMPPGAQLHNLAGWVEEHHTLMAWSLVRGHQGHLLNEAADSLARIAREWCAGVCSADDARWRARRLAQGFLADPGLSEVA